MGGSIHGVPGGGVAQSEARIAATASMTGKKLRKINDKFMSYL
jgi:hypothetical protein